jgi:hypothetical protein
MVVRGAAIPPQDRPWAPAATFGEEFGIPGEEWAWTAAINEATLQDIRLYSWVKEALAAKGLGIWAYLKEFIQMNVGANARTPDYPLWEVFYVGDRLTFRALAV